MPVITVFLLIALTFTLRSSPVWIINYMVMSVKGLFLRKFVLLLFFSVVGLARGFKLNPIIQWEIKRK